MVEPFVKGRGICASDVYGAEQEAAQGTERELEKTQGLLEQKRDKQNAVRRVKEGGE